MRTLKEINPSAEQLVLIKNSGPGIRVIRGAAGSGKTTTAILMARMALGYLRSARRGANDVSPIRAAIFTYNKTLEVYIGELAEMSKLNSDGHQPFVDVRITTFARYARNILGITTIDNEFLCLKGICQQACGAIGVDWEFLFDEVNYILGRFLPKEFDNYLVAERTGRGIKPRVERSRRQQIIQTVIQPYIEEKTNSRIFDWNDLALGLCANTPHCFDLIIVDECQDFSANNLRAIIGLLKPGGYLTFIIDTNQRLYKHGFRWKELNIDTRNTTFYSLNTNYRNPPEILRFVQPLLEDLPPDEDATLPLLRNVQTIGGQMPVIMYGTFEQQCSYVCNYIKDKIDLSINTVAILSKSNKVADKMKSVLDIAGMPSQVIARADAWPGDEIQIAVSTIHSVKGLEFDYVFILNISNSQFPFTGDLEDDNELGSKRQLAMAITRAKTNVILGVDLYKKSPIVDLFKDGTFYRI